MSGLLSQNTTFNPLFVASRNDQALNEDACGVNMIGIDRAGGNKFFNLRHRHRTACSDHRIEVSGRFSIHQIATLIADPCLHDSKVRFQTGPQYIPVALEPFFLLSFFADLPDTSPGVEANNTGATCSSPFIAVT